MYSNMRMEHPSLLHDMHCEYQEKLGDFFIAIMDITKVRLFSSLSAVPLVFTVCFSFSIRKDKKKNKLKL